MEPMHKIIPLPARIEERPGFFQITPGTCISTDPINLSNAYFIHDLLSPPTGFLLPIQVNRQPQDNSIYLQLDPALTCLGNEGYRLEVQPALVAIRACTPAGIFYGLQSLRQLLPHVVEQRRSVQADWRLPCIRIEDLPRFSWRGFMLDEGRHFHGRQTVLQVLDWMALQKLNTFHWHLTDDQGWRIAIEKYPDLTRIGSCRPGTTTSMFSKKHTGMAHCGFYSQQEIGEIVAYAAKRYITIVPEIEMPGHSLAALAAYPELSCTGGPFEVATHFGIFPDILCAGRETTFNFLENVLDEIITLFPSSIIHIGGDEVPKSRWKKCPACQSRIQSQGGKDAHALQVWFTNRIARHIESQDRRIMGWNQILEDDLSDSAIVQYWAGDRRKLVQAICRHRPVVMSTYLETYLDHGYALMPLSRAYRYEPIPKELAGSETDSVLGLEAPLWSEWVPTRERLDYQCFPRLCAFAETGWTPREQKDLASFTTRLAGFLQRLDQLGVHYAPLSDVEPARWRQRLGIFTIAFPQTRVALGGS